jgi:hypothetical protein
MTSIAYEVAATGCSGAGGRWAGEPPPEPLSESELSWIWAGQRYPAGALQLVDRRGLRVVSPGRPGGGAGPDFLDAVLEIDGLTVRGDVELHVRASGFRAHGHDRDPAYDGLALHVVFRADDGPATRLASGGAAPVAAFAPWLEGRTEELQGWLAAEALWREPCRDALGRLGEADVRAALRAAGRQRFEAKVAALQAAVAEIGEAEAVWRALLDALGVGGDRDGFRRLATAFPAALARSLIAAAAPEAAADRLAAALTWVAGLERPPPVESAALPARLRPALAGSGRPANRPERRLAGLAALYARCGGDLPGAVRASVGAADAAKRLVTAWQVARGGVALIGPERARELVLNVVLPFAAGDPALRERALGLLEGIGAGATYGKTAFLEANLRPPGGRRLARTALEQQGLLALLGEWCSRGGCGRCPLS